MIAKKKKQIVPIKERSAKTAGFICICRAQSFFENNAFLKGNDYIAPKMIPFSIKILLKLKVIKILSTLVPKSTYAYITARDKFFDTVIQKAITDRFEQIVTFCPGYDSRGIRFLNDQTKTKLFELDIKATQGRKLRQLYKQKIYIPKNITFVPIDFESESIKEKLLDSNFKGNKKTLFVLEGTYMVINKKTTVSIFELFHSITGKESEIIFDYIDNSFLTSTKKLKLITLLDANDIGIKYFNSTKFTKTKQEHFLAHAKKLSPEVF